MCYCDEGDYECNYGNEEWIHENDIPDLLHIEEHLEGIIEAIYVTGNMEALESCLEEVCHQFDMKLPKKEPILWKKPTDEEFSKKIFNLGALLARSQVAMNAIR